MHKHDQEMIMALAEGSLDPAAAAAAEAEVETCLECRRDLELQRVALDAFREAAPVYMTAEESATLHHRLHRELRIDSPTAVIRRPRGNRVRVVSWAAGAAAVFVAVLMLGPVLSRGGDDATETVALDDSASVTTAAAMELVPQAPSVADAAEDGAMTQLEDESQNDLAAGAAQTTAAFASEGLGVVAEGDLDEELRAEILAALGPDLSFAPYEERMLEPFHEACLTDGAIAKGSEGFEPPAGTDPLAVGLIVGEDGQERLLVAYPAEDVDETVLVAVSLPSCEVYQTVP